MTLKKFVTYISYVGCVVFAIGFFADMLGKPFHFSLFTQGTTRYLMFTGVALMAADWFYKFCHFKEYKEENKHRLIHFAVIAACVFFFVFIKSRLL